MAGKVGFPSLRPCAVNPTMGCMDGTGRSGSSSGRRTHTVLVVLFDGVQSLDVTGPLEVFSGVSRLLGDRGGYRVHIATLDGGAVRSSSGLLLTPDTSLPQAPRPDTLLVPGGIGTRRPDPRLIDWLRGTAPHARRVVSVCTGAFLLAEAGLLDGRRATTHW